MKIIDFKEYFKEYFKYFKESIRLIELDNCVISFEHIIFPNYFKLQATLAKIEIFRLAKIETYLISEMTIL